MFNVTELPKNLKRAFLRAVCFLWVSLFSQVAIAEELAIDWEWENWTAVSKSAWQGSYKGIDNDRLFYAGGSDPSLGIWTDEIIYSSDQDRSWKAAGGLPSSRSHGVCVVEKGRIILAGGKNDGGWLRDCLQLVWSNGAYTTTKLADLPFLLESPCGAILENKLLLLGVTTDDHRSVFLCLDLQKKNPTWVELSSPPGPTRLNAIVAVQGGEFYLFGGQDREQPETLLTDSWRFSFKDGWTSLAPMPVAIAGAVSPAFAVGKSHIFLVGGQRKAASDWSGNDASILAYHTVTKTWVTAGLIPSAWRVTGGCARENQIILFGDNTAASNQQTQVIVGSFRPVVAAFGWWNYATLSIYPLIMVFVAYRVGSKGTSDEFFRGGGNIPWWAAGLSIYATMLSSITFMAIPAKAYVTDWSFYLLGLTVILLAPLVVRIYLPFFRQLKITSAYEYLEARFNLPARWFGSLSFIILQIGRTAIVLYLPALALSTVSSFPMTYCILIMGVICILMTFEGGLESVVWTDVAQSVILLLGAFATLAVAIWHIPGGVMGIIDVAQADGKFFTGLDWSSDLTTSTVWVILIGNLFITLGSYTAGQDIVQRYISTESTEAASRSVWLNAWMVLPSTFLFFATGTALYVFYKTNPATLDPTLSNDAIFPLFIVRELPAGIGGLVVAGIFAAAQPTSSLNSIATAWVTDFHARLMPSLSDRGRLLSGKVATVLSGVIGTAIAMLMAIYNVSSAWDSFLGMLALTGSVLTGLFALGIFSRRATGAGATAGMLFSAGLLFYVQSSTNLHSFTHATIGFVACVVVGWGASLILPSSKKDLTGLTIFDCAPQPSIDGEIVASQSSLA